MPRKYEDYFHKMKINGVEVTVFNNEWFLMRDVAEAAGYSTADGLRLSLAISYGENSGHMMLDSPPSGRKGFGAWVHVSAIRTGPLKGRRQTSVYVQGMNLLSVALEKWPHKSVPARPTVDEVRQRTKKAISSIGHTKTEIESKLGIGRGNLWPARTTRIKMIVAESYAREVLAEREAEAAKQTRLKNPFKSKMRSLKWTKKTTARNLGLSIEEVEEYYSGSSDAPKYAFALFAAHEHGVPHAGRSQKIGWRKDAFVESLRQGADIDAAMLAVNLDDTLLGAWLKSDSAFARSLDGILPKPENKPTAVKQGQPIAGSTTLTSERWNLNGTPMQVSLKETCKDGVLTFSVTEHQPGMTVEHYSGPSPERAREAYERTAKAVGDFWAESMTLGM